MTTLVDPATLIVVFSFVGVFCAILAASLPLFRRRRIKERLQTVTKHREELTRQQRERVAQQEERRGRRRQARASLMKTVLERFNLKNMVSSPEFKQKLAMAGWRTEAMLVTFFYARIGTAVGGAGLTYLFLSLSDRVDMATPVQLLVAAGVGAMGFFFPNLMVKNVATKRQEAMKLAFPDALDLMVICVEGGLSVEAALTRVAEELAEDAPVLAEEIGLLTVELAFLSARREAFVNFSDRIGLQEVRAFTTAMIQSERYGTPVAVALKVLSQENRNDRMAVAEKKAGSLPALLTVPMILFFLPALFMVILGPPILIALNR